MRTATATALNVDAFFLEKELVLRDTRAAALISRVVACLSFRTDSPDERVAQAAADARKNVCDALEELRVLQTAPSAPNRDSLPIDRGDVLAAGVDLREAGYRAFVQDPWCLCLPSFVCCWRLRAWRSVWWDIFRLMRLSSRPTESMVFLNDRTWVLPKGEPAQAAGQQQQQPPLNFRGRYPTRALVMGPSLLLVLASAAYFLTSLGLFFTSGGYREPTGCTARQVALPPTPPQYPPFPSCFNAPTVLPNASIASFCAGLGASGGVFTAAIAPFAGNVCAPILLSLQAPVGRREYTTPGLIAYLFDYDANSHAGNPAGYLAVLVPYALFLLAFVIFRADSSPMVKGAPLLGLAEHLDNILDTDASLHMVSYTQRGGEAGMAVPHLLALELKNCYIDRACLSAGSSIKDATLAAAIHTRCLVLYITSKYLTSAACLRELFAAMLHRSGSLTAVLCCEGQESTVGIDWEGLRSALHEAFPCALSKEVGFGSVVFTELAGFLRWVRQVDLPLNPTPLASQTTLQWFRRHGRLVEKCLATAGLSNMYPTRSMHRQPYAYCSRPHGRLHCCVNAERDTQAGLFTLSSRGLSTTCCLTSLNAFQRSLLLVLALLLLIAAVCAADYASPPEPGRVTSGSFAGLYGAMMNVFDSLTLMGWLLLFLQTLLAVVSSHPRSVYDHFLEPLCVAAQLEVAGGEGGVSKSSSSSSSSSKRAAMQPLFRVHLVRNSASEHPSARAFLDDFRTFLEQGIGLSVVEQSFEEAAGEAREAAAAAQGSSSGGSGSSRSSSSGKKFAGLYVVVLDSVAAEDCAAWLDIVASISAAQVVPVVGDVCHIREGTRALRKGIWERIYLNLYEGVQAVAEKGVEVEAVAGAGAGAGAGAERQPLLAGGGAPVPALPATAAFRAPRAVDPHLGKQLLKAMARKVGAALLCAGGSNAGSSDAV
jgi:hypothetical protein